MWRVPDIKFPAKMAKKSEVKVLCLDIADPASSTGMIHVSRNHARFVPHNSDGTFQSVLVHGDQKYVERGG